MVYLTKGACFTYIAYYIGLLYGRGLLGAWWAPGSMVDSYTRSPRLFLSGGSHPPPTPVHNKKNGPKLAQDDLIADRSWEDDTGLNPLITM